MELKNKGQLDELSGITQNHLETRLEEQVDATYA